MTICSTKIRTDPHLLHNNTIDTENIFNFSELSDMDTIIFYSFSFLIVKGVFGDEVKSVSVMEGDSLTLHTDIIKQKDDMVVWSYGPENTFVGRINGKAGSIMLSENEKFKDRVKLDHQTGDLIITDVIPEHTGDYTCKISRNNKVSYKKFKVMVNDEVKSVIDGIPVTLHTNIVKQKDDMVVWSYGPENTFVARINGKAGSIMLSENEKFKDRVKLDDQTGDLTITDIRTTDSGDYTCKISRNNKVSYKKFNVMVNGVSVDEVKSVMEGDFVTLNTHMTEIQRHDELEWRKENIRIARIKRSVNDNPIYYNNDDTQRFKDRLQVNHQTGDLNITDITNEHTGLYVLKIESNNKILYKKFNVTVYGVFGDPDKVKSVSVMEGDVVTLHTNITQIQSHDMMVWYYGPENTLVARINGKAGSIMLSDDERFRDRVMLNDQTGDLIITDITTTDSGCYNLKIRSDNKIAYKKFNITVTAYQPVTKISIRDQAHLNIDDVCQTCSDSPVLRVAVISGVLTVMLCVISIIIICVCIHKRKKARSFTTLHAKIMLMDEENCIKPGTSFKDPETSSFLNFQQHGTVSGTLLTL